MIIKIADTAKKLISLILSILIFILFYFILFIFFFFRAQKILIDPCTKVTKTGSVCSNIQFFERK